MDLQFALNQIVRHIDRSPPSQNTRFHTSARRAECAPQVPSNDMWGHPVVATLTTVWVEELGKELPAVKTIDEEFEYGMHFELLHLCHDCGNPWCQKTHRTWFSATILDSEPMYEHNEYLGCKAYFEEFNQYHEDRDTVVSAVA